MQTPIGMHLAENPTHSLTLNCQGGEWFATIYQYGGMFRFTSGPCDCPSEAMDHLAEDIEDNLQREDTMDILYRKGVLRAIS